MYSITGLEDHGDKMSDNNDDFLLVDVDSASSAMETARNGSKKGKKDPAVWLLPTIKNTTKSYDAMIRLMPRGVTGLKNKLHPTVPVAVHYVKDPDLKLFVSIPCRRSLGVNEYCPYCDKQRKQFFHFKAQNDQDMMKKWDGRQSKMTHIGNFFIREDIVNPANTGTVKLWEHTTAVNKKLLEPLEKEDPNAPKSIKKKQRFNPYSPLQGRDFILEVRQSAKNPDWPTYDGCAWDENPSDLAPSKEEIIALLDKCVDLQKYIDEVPSVEQINHMMQEWDEKEYQANAQRNSGGTSANFANRNIHTPPPVSAPSANEFLGVAPAVDIQPKAQPVQTSPVPAENRVDSIFNLNDDSSSSEDDAGDELPF